MVASTDASIAALPDLTAYVTALHPVVAAWAALPADKASVLDSATQAITDLNSQVTQARRPPPSPPPCALHSAAAAAVLGPARGPSDVLLSQAMPGSSV